MASYQGVVTSIPKLHKYDQYIDECDYSSIIIMQDDGIHASLCSYSDESNTCNMEVEFFMLCNFFVSENYLSVKNNFLRHLEKWL